jgi:hypothetical protein
LPLGREWRQGRGMNDKVHIIGGGLAGSMKTRAGRG